MVKVPSQQTPTARRQAPKKHHAPTSNEARNPNFQIPIKSQFPNSKFQPQPLRRWLGTWSLGFGVRNFASAFLTLSLVSPAAPNAFGATSPPTPETNSPGSVEYNVGDSAREDITTPIPLVVIDQEQTTALRQKRALRVPVICRYYTNVADQVESEFRSAFAETRSNFLNSVEASFPERFRDRKLEPSSLISPKFHRLTVSFQKQNKSFPVSTNLAALWAQGDSDRVLLASLAASLRELMAHPIRPDALPPDIKQLSFNVRLVSLPDRNAPLNLETALARGVNLRRTNIIALKRAKNELQEAFPAVERPMARFLASFLTTNCVIDPELTAQVRAKRTEALWATDHYEAGQLIAKRGQVIDKKLKAALDQLREKTALGSLEQQVRQDQWQAEKTLARDRAVLGISLTLLLLLLLALWRLARRSSSATLLPARVLHDDSGALVISCPTCSETIVVPSPDLIGKDVIPAAHVRQRLLPHLAHLLMDKFVHTLISQRSDLLETQEKAAAEMAELEERLARVHAPLQERLRAYEQRISDLEKELAQKGEENRELIKAKIQMARKHLEAAKDWVEVN